MFLEEVYYLKNIYCNFISIGHEGKYGSYFQNVYLTVW